MTDTKGRISTSIDRLLADLRTNPEYRKAERLVSPFYRLAVDIINRRIRLGLTQKDLAERVGTFQSRISKIESGEHDIRLSTLINIAEALGTQLSIKMIPVADSVYLSDASPYTSIPDRVRPQQQSYARYYLQSDYQSQSKSIALNQ